MQRFRTLAAALTVAAALLLKPAEVAGQGAPEPWLEPLRRVLPAERYTDRQGDPPVFRAYRTDTATGQEVLAGYAFVTSDFQPEEMGFDGPVDVLVGMDLQGVLTGVLVLGYHESLRNSRGDFLSTPGFQQQFTGKTVADAFQVKRDVDGITGATLTVGAMSRGIRNAVRRVALSVGVGTGAAAAAEPPLDPVSISTDQLARLSWTEMLLRGLVQQIQVLDNGRTGANVSLFYLRDDDVAERVIGPRFLGEARARAGERAAGRHWLVAGVEGPLGGGINLARLALVQGTDTVRVSDADVLLFGPPREGKLDGQVAMTRVLLVDPVVDMERPFTFVLDLRPGLGVFRAEYPGRRAVAEASPAGRNAEPLTAAVDSAADGSPAAAPAAAEAPAPSAAAAAPTTPPASNAPLDLVFPEEQQTLLERAVAGTSWARVAALAALLAMAAVAFGGKRRRLRQVTLAASLIHLGVVDRGFLSVSHITSGIRVGPQVYVSDFALLLLVVFTVVTTLFWGRVFCGYLCPFGVLQDLIERVTPRRFKRELPLRVHRGLALGKFGALVVVLTPALLGSGLSLYQYLEPFGTVFFASRSLLLWGIVLSLLAASAVIPRFYCRYVCPLGAALALGSLLAPFRIRRVEQCGVCKVCEQRCPTRAIERERIDFKECVRCNVCEIELIEKAGVCRHDMEEVRSRLVQLKDRRRVVTS
jgi:Na+-translocating ferredoxin:NAD+ oxidoreductase RnfG subunit